MVGDDEPVSIEPAAHSEAAVIANLLELYIHDLSAVFQIEPGPDGRFGYPKLPLYWSEPEKRFPFLIRSGGKTIGFALVTRGSPASEDPDVWDIAEFFVLRGHRRAGVGRRAAELLFDRFKGRWIVRVCEGNRAAVPFWETVVGAYTRDDYSQTTREGSPHSWRDLSFVAPSEE